MISFKKAKMLCLCLVAQTSPGGFILGGVVEAISAACSCLPQVVMALPTLPSALIFICPSLAPLIEGTFACLPAFCATRCCFVICIGAGGLSVACLREKLLQLPCCCVSCVDNILFCCEITKQKSSIFKDFANQLIPDLNASATAYYVGAWLANTKKWDGVLPYNIQDILMGEMLIIFLVHIIAYLLTICILHYSQMRKHNCVHILEFFFFLFMGRLGYFLFNQCIPDCPSMIGKLCLFAFSQFFLIVTQITTVLHAIKMSVIFDIPEEHVDNMGFVDRSYAKLTNGSFYLTSIFISLVIFVHAFGGWALIGVGASAIQLPLLALIPIWQIPLTLSEALVVSFLEMLGYCLVFFFFECFITIEDYGRRRQQLGCKLSVFFIRMLYIAIIPIPLNIQIGAHATEMLYLTDDALANAFPLNVFRIRTTALRERVDEQNAENIQSEARAVNPEGLRNSHPEGNASPALKESDSSPFQSTKSSASGLSMSTSPSSPAPMSIGKVFE